MMCDHLAWLNKEILQTLRLNEVSNYTSAPKFHSSERTSLYYWYRQAQHRGKSWHIMGIMFKVQFYSEVLKSKNKIFLCIYCKAEDIGLIFRAGH